MNMHRQIALMMQAPSPTADLVFWANTYDPDTFEMLGVKTGVGGLTEGRAYQIQVPDYQGVYVAVPGGQPAWEGARWDDGVAYADNGSGVLLDPLPRLVHAPQATNLMPDSWDLTASLWAVNNSCQRYLTQDGMGGEPNTATLIQDAVGSAAYLNGMVDVPADTQVYSVIFRIKKEPDNGRFFGPKLAFGGEAGPRVIYSVSTETGDFALAFSADLVSEGSVVDSGLWWSFVVTANNPSESSVWSTVYPAVGTELGVVSGTAQGTTTVGNVEIYAGMSHEAALRALPIFTDGASATRDASALFYDTANHDDTAGTYLLEIDHGPDGQMLLSEFLRVLGADMRLTDGVNVADVASAAGPHTVGITYGDGSMQLTVDDVESGVQPYDGSLLVGALDLFRGSPNVGYAGEIKRYGESNVPAPNYDYVIALTGDDTNPGTVAQPWRHLSKITSALVQQEAVVRVLVKSGNYADGVLDTVELVGNGTYLAGTLLEITFESGCVIDGTLVTEERPNCFEIGDGNLPVTIYGNGVALREFNIPSANLIGTRDSVIVNIYDVDFFSGEDGITGHSTETVNLYSCIFRQGVSRPVINTGSSNVSLTNCDVFGLVSYGSETSGTLHRCRFTPRADGQPFHGPITVTQSIVGSNSLYYEFTPIGTPYGDQTTLIEDSYICLYQDFSTETIKLQLTRCFGRLGAKARPSMLTMAHCCITQNAGVSGIPTSNYDPGSVGQYLIQNNIIHGIASVSNVDAYIGDYMEASGSLIQNNIRLVDRPWNGIPAAILSGDLTSDPQITAVDGSSYDMADYAFAVGSPAEGAGLGGTDIGFSLAEVVPVGPEWL